MVAGGLLDEKVGEGVLVGRDGEHLVKTDKLGSFGIERSGGPGALLGWIDPLGLERRPVELEMESQLAEHRERGAAIEIGGKQSGPGGLVGLGAELGPESLGLALDPPPGRSKDEADLGGCRVDGIEMEKIRQIGGRDDAAGDLLGAPPVGGFLQDLKAVATGLGLATTAEVCGESLGLGVGTQIGDPGRTHLVTGAGLPQRVREDESQQANRKRPGLFGLTAAFGFLEGER